MKIRVGMKQRIASTEDVNAPYHNNTTIKLLLAVKENEEGWGSIIIGLLTSVTICFGEIYKLEMTREISWVLWWRENNVPVF